MEDLNFLRQKIDACDKEIYRLFAERMAISAKIALLKRSSAAPVRDTGREKEKETAARSAVPAPLAPYAARLYKSLACLSRDYQTEILKKEGSACPTASSDQP